MSSSDIESIPINKTLDKIKDNSFLILKEKNETENNTIPETSILKMKCEIEKDKPNSNLFLKNMNSETSVKVKTYSKDKGWGWIIVIGSLGSHILSDGVIYSYGVLTPEFINYFGITRSTVGWMGSILVAVTLGSGPLASYLCKKFSYRTVAVTGSLISAIGFAIPYFYNNLWFLIITSSVICGIGFGLVYLPSIIIINFWFEKKRSLATGIAVCGSGIGTFLFSPFLDYLIMTFQWQLAMLITGGILLLLIPCSLTYIDFESKDIQNGKIKEEKEQMENKENLLNIQTSSNIFDKNIEENCAETNKRNINNMIPISTDSVKVVMTNPIFLLFIVSVIFSNIGFNAPYMFVKDRAVLSGISPIKGSFLISSIGVGNCFGRVGFGYLAGLKSVNRFHLYNFTLVMSGLILIISWIMKHYFLMILYTFTYGMMSGGLVTLTSVILIDLFGIELLSITFGIILVFEGISVLVGSPIAGFIYDSTLSFDISFTVCGFFITLSGLIMYFSYISKEFRKKRFR